MTEIQEKVTIEGVEYIFADLTQDQQALVFHIQDIDRHLNDLSRVMENHQAARETFYNRLNESLKAPPPAA